jgi:hypothetical protein
MSVWVYALGRVAKYTFSLQMLQVSGHLLIMTTFPPTAIIKISRIVNWAVEYGQRVRIQAGFL